MLRPNCKDCTKRYPGCHDKCESFIEYRKEYDRIRDLRQKDIDLERGLRDVKRARVRDR